MRAPGRNVTPPTGELANSGWQYEGSWHSFTGTAIAPHDFLTATHVGGFPGEPFIFHGKTYRAIDATEIPGTDLCVWRVSGTFSTWAPLYAGSDEVSRDVVLFGRGLSRGAPIRVGGHLEGWKAGPSDSRISWGRSWVQSIGDGTHDHQASTAYGQSLMVPFDADAGPDAGCVSPGDSGGGVFLKDNDGVWKLAGIIYGVQSGFYRDAKGHDPIEGTLFDSRGVYRRAISGATSFIPFDSADPYPVQSIVSRTSPYLPAINRAVRSSGHTTALLTRLALIVGIPLVAIVAIVFFAVRRARNAPPADALPKEEIVDDE